MRTSITIGKKNNGYQAVILEGDGTKEGDAKKVIPLKGNASTPEADLVKQLPAKYRKQLEKDEADLVTIY